MKKVTLKVCVSCRKCKERLINLLKKTEGVKTVELINDCCPRVAVTGDFQVEDILKATEKFNKAFALLSIEDIPPAPAPPPPPKVEPPKAAEEAPKDPPKAEEPPKPEEPAKPAEEPAKPAEEPAKPAEEPAKPKAEEPLKVEEKPPEPEPPKKQPPPKEPEVVPPATIIVSDSLPPAYSYGYDRDESCYPPDSHKEQRGESVDLAIVIGLMIVIMALLLSSSTRSSSVSMSEVGALAVRGFLESIVSAAGTLFLIVLGLFAVMGLVCLADYRPQPCTC